MMGTKVYDSYMPLDAFKIIMSAEFSRLIFTMYHKLYHLQLFNDEILQLSTLKCANRHIVFQNSFRRNANERVKEVKDQYHMLSLTCGI